MSGFEQFMDFIHKWEGVYSNDPRDINGGETLCGIARKQHPDWVGFKVLDELKETHGERPSNDVMLRACQGHVYDWYRDNVWTRIKAKDLHPAVALFVADMAVNQGTVRAVKALQEAVKVSQDGIMGPNTLASANAMIPEVLLKRLAEIRTAAYMSVRKDLLDVYKNGWSRRLIDALYEAQDLLD